MWSDLLIVSVIGGIVAVDTTAGWQVMICRPIVSGPLLGFLLGDLQNGLLLGAVLELVWAGIVPAGASVFPDSNVAAVVATAVVVCLNPDFTSFHFIFCLSILYSIPVAYFGSKQIVWIRKRNSVLMERALRYADKGDARRIVLQNWLGLINSFARGFLFSGVMFIIGLAVLSAGLGFAASLGSNITDQSRIPILALGGAVGLSIFGSRRTLPLIGAGLAIGLIVSSV